MFAFDKELKQIEDAGRFRKLNQLQGADFSSNDYLGLSNHPRIRKALIQALNEGIPLGSGASRLIPGYHEMHEEVEEQLRLFFQREAVLMFNSGYTANIGVLSTLGKEALIFSDALNHASIIDGIRLSKSECRVYRHKDMNHLEDLLKESSYLDSQTKKIIVSESLFSMDGDFAPLETLVELAEKYHCFLMVDEAHATGVYGENGRGLMADSHSSYPYLLSMHTCGKAFGCYGAFVTCSQEIKEYLINFCRNFIFTTALPPPVLVHLQEVLQVLKEEPERRLRVLENAKKFREMLSQFGDIGTTQSQIVPFILGSNTLVVEAADLLLSKGFHICPIRYPTVPKGAERLRICIHADHSLTNLETIANFLKEFTSQVAR